MCTGRVMYDHYYEDWQVKITFNKEYVSLWDGWLGKDNYHKLSEVTEDDWSRFGKLIKLIAKDYDIERVDTDLRELFPVNDIDEILSSFKDSMEKESDEFTKIVIPKLKCVITEDWDFTYIIWHKSNGAVESLASYIKAAKLCQFTD